MRIYRIDATYPGDEVLYQGEYVEDLAGMQTRFAREASDCDAIQRSLADAGWEFDVYEEEIGDVEAGQLKRLLAHPWPVLGTAHLLDLAASPKTAARERLDEILRGKSAAAKAPTSSAAVHKAAAPIKEVL